MGRGLRELYSHYIYMAPESPFMKIVWSNLEIMLKACVEGALIGTATGIAAGAGIPVIICSATAYTLFIFMLIGINYVSLRFTGADMSSGLLLMLYMLAVLLVLSPGVAAAIFIGVNAGVHWALAALSGWELLAALCCFWASRNILHACDIPAARQNG